MLGPRPQVPVKAPRGLVADRDDPGLAALAEDPDLPAIQVQVTALRIAWVVADAGQLREPDTGRLEHGQDRGVASVREAAALACPPQGGKFFAGEHRHQRDLHRRGRAAPSPGPGGRLRWPASAGTGARRGTGCRHTPCCTRPAAALSTAGDRPRPPLPTCAFLSRAGRRQRRTSGPPRCSSGSSAGPCPRRPCAARTSRPPPGTVPPPGASAPVGAAAAEAKFYSDPPVPAPRPCPECGVGVGMWTGKGLLEHSFDSHSFPAVSRSSRSDRPSGKVVRDRIELSTFRFSVGTGDLYNQGLRHADWVSTQPAPRPHADTSLRRRRGHHEHPVALVPPHCLRQVAQARLLPCPGAALKESGCGFRRMTRSAASPRRQRGS